MALIIKFLSILKATMEGGVLSLMFSVLNCSFALLRLYVYFYKGKRITQKTSGPANRRPGCDSPWEVPDIQRGPEAAWQEHS